MIHDRLVEYGIVAAFVSPLLFFIFIFIFLSLFIIAHHHHCLTSSSSSLFSPIVYLAGLSFLLLTIGAFGFGFDSFFLVPSPRPWLFYTSPLILLLYFTALCGLWWCRTWDILLC